MKQIKLISMLMLFCMATSTSRATGTTLLRNQSGSAVSFYYINEIRNLISITIPAGKSEALMLETPVVLYYSVGASKLPFYIRPADTLHISFDENGDLLLASADSVRTNELKLLREIKIRFNNTRTTAMNLENIRKQGQLKQSRASYEAHLAEEYRKKSEFFNTYIQTHTTGKAFREYVKNYLYYQMMSDKIANLPLTGEVDSLTDYKNALHCDTCLSIDMYTSLAQHYAFRMNNVFGEKSYQAATEQFTGQTREFMRMFLMQLYNKNNLRLFEANYNKFISETQYGPYRNCITELKQAEMLNRDFTNSGLLLSLKGDTVRLETLLNTFSGKHVYIDFWASWCVPCIDAIPATRSFEDTSKTTVVIYLSLDKYPSAWKQYAKNLGLGERESYLVAGNFESALAHKYRISAIPHYVLISKSRKTVVPSAPGAKGPGLGRLIGTLK